MAGEAFGVRRLVAAFRPHGRCGPARKRRQVAALQRGRRFVIRFPVEAAPEGGFAATVCYRKIGEVSEELAAMPAPANDNDVTFYRLIHELVARQPGTAADRRSNRRNPFRIVQQIAGWDGGRFPAKEAFFDARCHDLTGGGFSFLSPRRPPFEQLVAAFGKPPEQIFIAAEVRHLIPVLVHASGTIEPIEGVRRAGPAPAGQPPAQAMVLVGCRFCGGCSNPAP